ncbi:DeoR/GlpR family DNA-binding transcription regulator [bacterium]|nr:DeoR/GlpR family DNA-binding transcription regulator [bacterium]
MNAEKRHNAIQQLLKKHISLSVPDLQAHLGVSIATIRRDLIALEKADIIRRTHGGAVIRKRRLLEETYRERETKLVREKQLIAEKAVEFIREGDRIFLNDGTTNNRIAALLARKDFPHRLIIMTNSIRAADILLSNRRLEVLFIGGLINEFSYACAGPITELVLDHLKADKAIVGADGFDPRDGISIERMPEASVTRKMISLADQTIVVGDSSKMNSRAFMRVSTWRDVDVFITDHIDPEDRKIIEGFNVHISEPVQGHLIKKTGELT